MVRCLALYFFGLVGLVFAAPVPLPVLVIDGQNNHDWRTTTAALQSTLEATGLFEVAVASAPEVKFHSTRPREPKSADEETTTAYLEAKEVFEKAKREAEAKAAAKWQKWLPDFKSYRAVILNYNGRSWPEPMQKAFVSYMKEGGGLVLVHAANNAFRDWPEFNEIIGLGYGGERGGAKESTKCDPTTGEQWNCCAGENSGHGAQHPFLVTVRKTDHPIMRGLPGEWLHGKDELYHNLRGPGKGMKILSSAYSDPKTRGTGHHEPITYASSYGKGRCVVTTMGHFWERQINWDSLYCVGFQTVFARSVEFVAAGEVTLEVPAEFPGKEAVSIVAPHKVTWRTGGKPVQVAQSAKSTWKEKKAADEFAFLTPTEAAEAMVISDEFVVEAVASEPMVQEPVLCVWDGDGAMYVAEMRSYMQDENGEGTKSLRNGRVKKLVDDDGDGIMDRATVFVDGLNLPRMILPLDDRIAVVETDNTSVWSYRDTTGDGVADEKKLLFKGRAGSGTQSVEHQDSGLIWNLDNWIYVSYARERYRFTDGVWRSESYPGHWAQWGLDRDDEGRIYYSDNSAPLKSVQVPRLYLDHIKRASGRHPKFPPSVGFPYDHEFLEVPHLVQRDDRGGTNAPRERFTSLCGQSVFRGDSFPQELRGNYFVCDPTLHVVRRARIENQNGKLMLQKTEKPEEEFLTSHDFYFRPVNTATGPDGCLYVVDMCRGIIQDAPWYNDSAREFARKSKVNQVVQKGRIWRVRHRDHKPRPRSQMLSESTGELIRHFESRNGWVRDTAQKLILLREDRDSVAPLLEAIVRFDEHAPLVRLHALWTLEGMGRADRSVARVLGDRDSRLRSAAIRIGEAKIKKGDKEFLTQLATLVGDREPEVAKQLILTLGWSKDPEATALIEQAVRNHLGHDGVFLAAMASLWGKDTPLLRSMRDGSLFKGKNQPVVAQRWLEGLNLSKRQDLQLPKEYSSKQKWLIGHGETIYFNSCRTCHGVNGLGEKIPGTELTLAPPLVNSPRVKGDPEKLLRILLHGLHGPVNGKTYGAGIMVPIAALGHTDPNRITQIANYLRYAWGHEIPPFDVELTKKVITESKGRKTPWTLQELEE